MSNFPKIPEEKMKKTTITKKLEDGSLSDDERELVDKIGENNLDYCILSLLKGRFPDYEFVYSEEDSMLFIDNGEEEIEMDFSKEYFEPIFEQKNETLKEWLSKILMIYKGLFKSKFS